MDLQELWKTALGEIELYISKANFRTWFNQINLIDKDKENVRIAAPNNFVKEWLESKFNLVILKALHNLDPEIKHIEYIIKSNSLEVAKKPKTRSVLDEVQLELATLGIDKETNLNPRYTFSNFIVGSSNELAHAAAVSISKNLAKNYNPLFVYGGTGLGKTHLLQAIGNEVKNLYKSKKKVYYLSSEKFINELIRSLKAQQMEEFKEKYRKFDVFIVDDIQFIAGKARSQEELFHTFNALYEKNRQIVFSSDRAPKLIPDLEDRLRSRFEGGMLVDILPPDYEMKLAILSLKLQEMRTNLPKGGPELIASKIQKNIRELEGVLNRVVLRFGANPKVTLADIEVFLQSTAPEREQSVNPAKIIQKVANFYELSEKELVAKTRKKEIVKPRQIAMYLIREIVQTSFPSIGEKFGGRDHTTVIHACYKIKRDFEKNPTLQKELEKIKEQILNS